MLEHANKNGILKLINCDLVFDNASTNTIKMNYIKTMLTGNFVRVEIIEKRSPGQ